MMRWNGEAQLSSLQRDYLVLFLVVLPTILLHHSRQVDAFHLIPTDLPSSSHSASECPSVLPSSSICTHGFVSNGHSCIRTDDGGYFWTVDDRSSSSCESHPTKEDHIGNPVNHDDNGLPFVRHPQKKEEHHRMSTSDSDFQSVATIVLSSSASSISKQPDGESSLLISQRLREILTKSTLVMVNVARILALDQV